MAGLRHRELKTLLDFVRSLYAVASRDAFQRHLLTSLPTVVAADVTAYLEFSRSRPLAVVTDPPDALDFPDSRRLLQRHMHESPLLGAYTRGQGSAVKVSDYLTRREFERLALYQQFFRRFGSPYTMAKGLPGLAGVTTAVTLHRTRRDFSEGDRWLINALGPHLNQALRNAEMLGRFNDEIARVRRAVEKVEHGLVVLNREGQVGLMTTRARDLLTRYLGAAGRNNRLPDPLVRWIAAQQAALASADAVATPQRPFLVEREDGCLVARLVADPEQTVVMLDEQKQKTVKPERLAALGLSARQAEVLAWVAEGKTNVEIAVILGTSPRTVDKHVEHIFRALGVETRTAAAARALGL